MRMGDSQRVFCVRSQYMVKFAATYPDREFVQMVSAQISWPHNVAILDKVKMEKQRGIINEAKRICKDYKKS